MKKGLIPLVSLTILLSILSLSSCDSFDEEHPAVDGIVWVDANQDGIEGENEERLSNVEVRLYDSEGTLIGKTTTRFGYFSFPFDDDFIPGTYYLEFVMPEGYQVAGLPEFSQVDPSTGRSITFEIEKAGFNTLDLGLIPQTSTSGSGSQETITLTPSEDTVVTGNGTDANFGDLDNFWIDAQSTAYLRFLLDGLPADYLVESVTLSLFSDGSGHAGGETATATCPDSSQPWDEMGLTWNNRSSPAPGAPASPFTLSPDIDQHSVNILNMTDAFRYCQQAQHYYNYFDAMIYFSSSPAPGVSQGWYSRQSEYPPQLNITYTVP